MPNVKTVILTGTETAVTFPQNHPYYMILNMGGEELYASGNPGIVPYADGVYAVPAGTEIRISPEASGDTVWLLGSGRVQVRAEEIAAQTSFKPLGKGGDVSAFIYSMEEQIVGSWTNGKPLYQKTICFDITAENSQAVYHNIENVELIWDNHSATFFVNTENNLTTSYFNFGVDENGNMVTVNLRLVQTVDSQKVIIRCGKYADPAKVYITLNYTKTTDK